jgi:hypothetical protein
MRRASDNLENLIDVNKLTYWMPREVKPHCEGFITIGKVYKLYYNELLGEYYILDDAGCNAAWFLTIDGDYIQIP